MGYIGTMVEPLLWAYAHICGSWASLPEFPATILVVRSADLGDSLTTTPIFQALRRRYPGARLIAAFGSWSKDVLLNNPFVDEIVLLDVPWHHKFVSNQSWVARLRFILSSRQVSELRKGDGYDIGIEVTGRRSGYLLLLRLKARYRIGVRGHRGGWSTCQRNHTFRRDVHVARATLAQAELLGATEIPEARPQIYLTSEERSIAATFWGQQYKLIRLVVGVGAGLPEKCWPLERLAAALQLIQTADCHWDIILVGTNSDLARSTLLKQQVPNARCVCGQLSLRQVFALVEQSDIVLSHSSMLIHVAAAFRRPTITVLGTLIHPDAAAHDAMWGYPPPYMSISPAEQSGSDWPTPKQVVMALLDQAQQFRSRAPALPLG